MSIVIEEIRDRIAYLTLNRPEKRNALNAELVATLTTAVQTNSEKEEIRAIILKSSGDAFCAGADLAYLQQLQKNSYAENLEDSRNLAHLFQGIYASPKPVISMVDGPALAGGCGLATLCDLCFATPQSTFGYTEARIGFIPAIVLVFLRKKLGEGIGKRILFTGEVFGAEQAMQYGMITGMVGKEEIEEYVHEYVVKMITGCSGNSLALIKEMYQQMEGLNLEDALSYACKLNAHTRESEDCKRGIASFLNKEKIKW